MSQRERLHHAVDSLPDSDLEAALRLIEYLGKSSSDPMLRVLLTASEDGEALTREEEASLENAAAEVRRGETTSWDVVRETLD